MSDPVLQGMLDRSIELWRGPSTTIVAQKFFVWYLRSPWVHESEGTRQTVTSLHLVGDETANVQIGDRFSIDSKMFEVVYVRLQIAGTITVAECKTLA